MTTTDLEHLTVATPARLEGLAHASARIADALRQSACDDQFARRALDDLRSVLEMEHGAVFLHSGLTFSLAADTGTSAQACPLAAVNVQIADLIIGPNANARYVIDPGEIARIVPAAGDLRTLLLLPLLARTKAVGMILLGSAEEKLCTPAEEALLKLLGQCLASGLCERTLHDQLAEATDQLSAQDERLHRASISDPLTGLSNRQHFLDEIERTSTDAATRNTPLSLLLIDADHFKAVNDRYGMQFGDDVIRRIGEGIRQSIRGRDVASRFDGQKFSVLLPNTPGTGAVVVAEHLRESISALTLFDNEGTWALTVSIGVACLSTRVTTSGQLLAKAESCLLEAKVMGGNQIVFDWDELLAVMDETPVEE